MLPRIYSPRRYFRVIFFYCDDYTIRRDDDDSRESAIISCFRVIDFIILLYCSAPGVRRSRAARAYYVESI